MGEEGPRLFTGPHSKSFNTVNETAHTLQLLLERHFSEVVQDSDGSPNRMADILNMSRRLTRQTSQLYHTHSSTVQAVQERYTQEIVSLRCRHSTIARYYNECDDVEGGSSSCASRYARAEQRMRVVADEMQALQGESGQLPGVGPPSLLPLPHTHREHSRCCCFRLLVCTFCSCVRLDQYDTPMLQDALLEAGVKPAYRP